MSSLTDKIDLKLGKKYVYFSSLKDNHDLNVQMKIKTLESMLTKKVISRTTQLDPKTNQSKMDQALHFLGSAAQNERHKELTFFKEFTQNFPKTEQLFDLNFEDSDKDYITFIANINKTLKGASNFKKELTTEIDRMERYQNSRQYTKDGEVIKGMKKKYEEALTDSGKKASANETYFKRDGAQTFESLIRKGTIASEITNFIMSNFGGQIIQFTNGKLQLNSSNFATLVKILNDKAYAMLVDHYGKVDTIKDSKLSQQLNDNSFISEYTKFINDILNAPTLSNTLESIAKQSGINEQSMKKVSVTKNKINNLTEHLKTATKGLRGKESFEQWFSKNKGKLDLEDIVRAIGSVSVTGYYTGENLGATELISNRISALIGGRANTTDDILAGKLIIKMSLDTNASASASKLEQKMSDLQKTYYDQLKATIDYDSFESNTQLLRQLKQDQLSELKNFLADLGEGEEGLNHLISHINIHDTIKGYTSAGSLNFKKYKGFEGAAFGSNLHQQLKILSSTNAMGGLEEKDIEFFQFAMINAGSQMIGHNLKRTLEDYFSVFLSFFMFNDAALMIEEANEAAVKMSDQNTPGDLHIYQLNGVYVPCSYLLQKTYDELKKTIGQTSSQITSGRGTRAILHTYNGQPKSTWEETYTEAEKATKLEMKFLGGFFDLLGEISGAMNNLP